MPAAVQSRMHGWRLACGLFAACILPAMPSVVRGDEPARPIVRVLLAGNSLLYVNNTPGLLRGIATSQPDGPTIETASLLAPGSTLSEHLHRGRLQTLLQQGGWDVLVLQERGGLLACMTDSETRDDRECRASRLAHRRLLAMAREHDVPVLLLGTWGPGDRWQARLDAGLEAIACNAGCRRVFIGHWLQETARDQPALQPFSADAAMHPNPAGSLLIAARLYRTITGRELQPRPLRLSLTLWPPQVPIDPMQPLESQDALEMAPQRLDISADALVALYEAANREP